MRATGQRLSEGQIRERLDLVSRWKESGLSMTAWAQGQGLDAGALMGAVAYEGRRRAKLAGQGVNSKNFQPGGNDGAEIFGLRLGMRQDAAIPLA